MDCRSVYFLKLQVYDTSSFNNSIESLQKAPQNQFSEEQSAEMLLSLAMH